MVGQERSSFTFQEVMAEGKILLLNLRKGRFGPEVSQFLANQIICRLKSAAMERADMPAEGRRPFFLYVDEFQNVPQDSLIELLAEARKYNLGLILANQFAGQLLQPNGPGGGIIHALLGNVGIFVLFRLGIQDSALLSSVLYPTFGEKDLSQLPDYKAYVRYSAEGSLPTPFNIEAVKPVTPWKQDTADKVITYSRLKYGRDAKKVEKEIARRHKIYQSGIETFDEEESDEECFPGFEEMMSNKDD